jgi:hypothetical protein
MVICQDHAVRYPSALTTFRPMDQLSFQASYSRLSESRRLPHHAAQGDVSDRQVFSNCKPGLRLESARWKEDAEIACPSREEKDIYTCTLVLVCRLATWACPADSFSYLCIAGPLRTCKSQPKCGLFRAGRRAQTDFTVQSGCTANSQKGFRGALFLSRLTR